MGLIPAHAGKTTHFVPEARAKRAHPRSRGENPDAPGIASANWGSSPLTRGKPTYRVVSLGPPGLIPAHAGKTMTAIDARACRGAHPRSRGENQALDVDHHPHAGSSPLTRGKRGAVDGGRDGLRLIPAHAGKTQATRRRHQRPRAHPRSRGENSVPFLTRIMDGGSSPLTRGKRTEVHEPPRRAGLIPAHAGKTCAGRQCP